MPVQPAVCRLGSGRARPSGAGDAVDAGDYLATGFLATLIFPADLPGKTSFSMCEECRNPLHPLQNGIEIPLVSEGG